VIVTDGTDKTVRIVVIMTDDDDDDGALDGTAENADFDPAVICC
jgi:hypothetical protein